MQIVNADNTFALNRFTVSPVPGQAAFTTIQEAVNAAQTAGSGEIILLPGIYNESVNFVDGEYFLSAPSSGITESGPFPAVGAIIRGACTLDCPTANTWLSASNIVFEANTSSPALTVLNSNISFSTNLRMTDGQFMATSGDGLIMSGANATLINCFFNAAAGHKNLGLNNASFNMVGGNINGNDTQCVIVDGKNFIINVFIQDSFDVSGNPGPFLIIGGALLAAGPFAACTIHNGAGVFIVNCAVASNTSYLFQAGGIGDAGSITYGNLTTFSPPFIDPLLSIAMAPTLPYQIFGNNITSNTPLSAQNSYYVSSGALSLSLPTTSRIGDVIKVTLVGGTSWTITQGAGQQITMGNVNSTLGVSGSISSTSNGDSISIECFSEDTLWVTVSSIGTLAIT
jgi:hypothetical protein